MRPVYLLLGGLLLAGCPYSFSNSLPGHIKTVSIPVFENETLESELAEELTTAVTDRFVRDNQLSVVQQDADAELLGTITGFEDRVFGFNADQRADEYLVVLTVRLVFRDRVKNKEIWKEDQTRGVASYFLGSSQAGTPATVEQARALAITQIVDIIVSRTFEGW